MSGRTGAGAGSAPSTATVMAPTTAFPKLKALLLCYNPVVAKALCVKFKEVEQLDSSTSAMALLSSCGVDMISLTASGKTIQVWSTLTQDRYKGVSRYYCGADAFIVSMNVSEDEMRSQIVSMKQARIKKPLFFMTSNIVRAGDALPPALTEEVVSTLIASEGISGWPIKFVTLEGFNDKTALVAQIHELHAAQLALAEPATPAGS